MKHQLTLALTPILWVMLSAAANLSAHAACPSWPTADRFAISGEEVADKRTGLVWKRCSEGQTLGGSSCTGIAAGYTHEQALAIAKSANTADNANGWRLPNVKELASLADKGCQSPAIDGTAFPGTPSNYYYSSSPYVGNSYFTWTVIFSNGGVNAIRGDYYGQVRLVRASQ